MAPWSGLDADAVADNSAAFTGSPTGALVVLPDDSGEFVVPAFQFDENSRIRHTLPRRSTMSSVPTRTRGEQRPGKSIRTDARTAQAARSTCWTPIVRSNSFSWPWPWTTRTELRGGLTPRYLPPDDPPRPPRLVSLDAGAVVHRIHWGTAADALKFNVRVPTPMQGGRFDTELGDHDYLYAASDIPSRVVGGAPAAT